MSSSKLRQFKNTARDITKDGFARVPQNQFEARLKICHGCDKFNRSLSQCKSCGCIMKMKARFRASKCPEGKWF